MFFFSRNCSLLFFHTRISLSLSLSYSLYNFLFLSLSLSHSLPLFLCILYDGLLKENDCKLLFSFALTLSHILLVYLPVSSCFLTLPISFLHTLTFSLSILYEDFYQDILLFSVIFWKISFLFSHSFSPLTLLLFLSHLLSYSFSPLTLLLFLSHPLSTYCIMIFINENDSYTISLIIFTQ
ncbi:unnamed protein product [Acanthosepion pharaonis]|uniref:Uncharacterized protein n=1 Tax=Acanthosepion pharaonis TaxID=158019 RepID=A0A812BPW1_ACAPH|nr:unnamed protein product [Sepia pharaonis]